MTDFPTLNDPADVTVLVQAVKDHILDTVGLYEEYEPVWAASTTAPTLGNGTLTGRYARIGKTVHFRISLTFGSTTNRGAGTYSFTSPTNMAGPSLLPVGEAHMRDDSSVSRSARTAYRVTATTIGLTSEGGAFVTHDSPILLAVNDVIQIAGTYEEA